MARIVMLVTTYHLEQGGAKTFPVQKSYVRKLNFLESDLEQQEKEIDEIMNKVRTIARDEAINLGKGIRRGAIHAEVVQFQILP